MIRVTKGALAALQRNADKRKPKPTRRWKARGRGDPSPTLFVEEQGAGTLQVALGLPPPMLWPNARPHWKDKAKATAEYRREAFVAARSALGTRRPMVREARVLIMIEFATTQWRDPDAVLSACKAVFDGFQDAGLLEDDDHLEHEPVHRANAAPGTRGRVVVRVCW